MFEFLDDPPDQSHSDARAATPGQVRFDERGNAIYAWRDQQLEMDGKQAERLRERALSNPTLSLADDTAPPDVVSIVNPKGLRVGYNPYESGQLAGPKPATKKRDMRELSKWIEMKRRLGAQQNSGSVKK